MILQETIQEVFDTAQVEDVVSEFVHLKRRGTNMVGLCPFHDEKTPSFTVSPSKGIYKCFGCGKGGNSVNFLMEHEQMNYPEAIKYLADKYNIEVKEDRSKEDSEEAKKRESLFVVTEFASEFYQNQLLNSDEGKSIGRSYFRERGIQEQTIDNFDLGYAPGSGTALIKAAKKKSYSLEKLKETGLLNRYDKDFFRSRVIFPIHNLSGKVVAFAGRTLSSKDSIPKYINSPETEIYHKRKVLYGLHQARNSVRRKDKCILVEGYTDVLSLAQDGIENVVATSGTSLTDYQVRLIKRYTDNILVLYDGDEAGLKAAERGINKMLEEDMNISVVMLPQNQDPDSYMREVGKTAFQDYIETNSKDFILFKLKNNEDEAKDDPIKRANLIKDLVNSIALIPDALKQSMYLKQIGEKLDLQEELLTSELAKSKKKHRDKKNRQKRREQRKNDREQEKELNQKKSSIRHKMPELSDNAQEKDLIRVLLQFGQVEFDEDESTTVGENILNSCREVREEFEDPLLQKVYLLFHEHYQENNEILSSEYFIQNNDDELRNLAVDLLSEPYSYSENWLEKWDMPLQTQEMPEENFLDDMMQAIYQFKLRKIDKRIEENRNRIARYQKDGNEEELITHLEVQKKLFSIRENIANNLGRVLY